MIHALLTDYADGGRRVEQLFLRLDAVTTTTSSTTDSPGVSVGGWTGALWPPAIAGTASR